MTVQELFAKLGLQVDKRSFSTADRLLGAVKTALFGIVAFKSVKWFGGLVSDTSHAADGMRKLAQQVGLTSEELYKLAYAADLGGVPVENLRTSFQRLQRLAYDAENGMQSAKDAFKDAGVEFKNSDGSLRSVNDLIYDLADQFKNMPDGTKKTGLAMSLMGRSGAQMIPVLNGGSEALRAMGVEAEDLGLVIDDKTGSAFEQLNDDTTRLKAGWTGIKNQVVIGLLPTLQKLITRMLGWVKANKKLFAQKIAKVVSGLIKIVMVFAWVLGTIVDVIILIDEHIEIFAAGVLGLAGAFLILKFAAVQSAIVTAAAWLAALWPFVLLAVLIGAAILIVYDLWNVLNGGESIFEDLRQSMIDAFVGAIEWIHTKFKEFFDWVARKLDWVADKARDVLDMVTEPGGFVGDVAFDVFGDNGGVSDAGTIAQGRQRFKPKGPSVKVSAPRVRADITVNVPEGMDAEAAGVKVREAWGEFWDAKVRELGSEGE